MSFWAGSLKKTVSASDEQFTFAIPRIFFHSIYFRGVSLKNYLIFHVKQNKSMSESLTVSRFEGLDGTALSRLPLSPAPSPSPLQSMLSALICSLLPLGRGTSRRKREATIALNMFF